MILLFMLLVLLLIFLSFFKRENFTDNKVKKVKKCIICYYGAAFREGNMDSTTQDTKYGYKNQEYATKTHLKLHRMLKEQNIDYEVIINTYKSKHINKIKEWYNPVSLNINTMNTSIASTNGRDNLIRELVQTINFKDKGRIPTKDVGKYDFVLFIRLDLFLKPDFYNVLNTNSTTIQFLSHHYDPKNCHSYSINGEPVVNDLILYIPKLYKFILNKHFVLMHDSWEYYKKMYSLKNNDMGFMSSLMFDANTYKDLNPYYIISGRPENKTTHNNLKDNPNDYGQYSYTQFDSCEKYHIDDVLIEELTENPCQYYYNLNKEFYEV